MNPSLLNGPTHEWFKRFRPRKIIINGVHYRGPREGIMNGLRSIYFYIRYLHLYLCYHWSNPDGPGFMAKLWMLISDHLFGRLYSFNQNTICRSPNHSSVLSKKQNIGWFLYNSSFYIGYQYPSLKTLEVLFLREPENEAPWDRSKSIGMSFVNAIVSDEDAQFELYGHYKIWWEWVGIWSTYYYTDTLVRKAVKDYIVQSKQGLGPFNFFHQFILKRAFVYIVYDPHSLWAMVYGK